MYIYISNTNEDQVLHTYHNRPAAEPHAPPEVVEDVAMVDDVLLDGENTMAAANAPSHGSHPPLSACLTTPDTAGAVISPEPSADQGSEKVLQPRDLFREGALGAQRSTSDDHWVGVLPNSMAFDDARVSTPGSSARPSRRPSLGCLPEMQACLDALGGEWTSLQTKLAASPRHSRSSSLERQRSCAARMQGLLGGQSTLDELLDNLPSCGSRVGFQEGSAHHRPDSSGQPLVSSSTFVAFDCNPEALKDDTPPLVRVTAAVRGVDPAQVLPLGRCVILVQSFIIMRCVMYVATGGGAEHGRWAAGGVVCTHASPAARTCRIGQGIDTDGPGHCHLKHTAQHTACVDGQGKPAVQIKGDTGAHCRVCAWGPENAVGQCAAQDAHCVGAPATDAG